MKLKNVLVAYYVHNYKTLQFVQKILAESDILFHCVRRINLKPSLIKNKDLIIVVGGDGTFLRTAHMAEQTPILAVSSDARYNEAFFSRATKTDLKEKIQLIKKGKFKISKLPRLEAKINDRKLPILAINEIFVGSKHPYHTSRYVLKVKGKKEFQKSSGILIATQRGSSGWAKSASKKKLSITKNGFGFVVREPYFGRLTKPKLIAGCLTEQGKVQVTSLSHQGIVVVDSYEKEFKFTDGSKLEVSISKKKLNFIEF